MSKPSKQSTSPAELADRLHSASIHLLRRLRIEDSASGLTAPRLSALSVIVFGGPLTMTDLADAEQVSAPTISRLVRDLERERLVKREVDQSDRRVQLVRVTHKGRKLLEEGRSRRVAVLTRELGGFSPAKLSLLARALPLLESLSLSARHPRQKT